MDAKALWKQFAMSDEGRELAAALESAEDDQLQKLASLDLKISEAMTRLASRMDNKPLVAEKKCEAETLYRSRYFGDHCELTIKLPTEMVLELAEMLTHYDDHNCAPAAAGLDDFTKAVIGLMVESVPMETLLEHMDEDEEEEEDEGH